MNARALSLCLLLSVALPPTASANEIEVSGGNGTPVTVVVRDAPMSDVLRMLSRNGRVSILMHAGVDATISISLFDVPLDRAIRAVADAGGYVAEKRDTGYNRFVIELDDLKRAEDIDQAHQKRDH